MGVETRFTLMLVCDLCGSTGPRAECNDERERDVEELRSQGARLGWVMTWFGSNIDACPKCSEKPLRQLAAERKTRNER